MGLYDVLVTGYYHLLSALPPAIQTLITLILLIGVVLGFINLIRTNALFLILLVLVLPIVLPILLHFFLDVWHFVLFLLRQVGLA